MQQSIHWSEEKCLPGVFFHNKEQVYKYRYLVRALIKLLSGNKAQQIRWPCGHIWISCNGQLPYFFTFHLTLFGSVWGGLCQVLSVWTCSYGPVHSLDLVTPGEFVGSVFQGLFWRLYHIFVSTIVIACCFSWAIIAHACCYIGHPFTAGSTLHGNGLNMRLFSSNKETHQRLNLSKSHWAMWMCTELELVWCSPWRPGNVKMHCGSQAEWGGENGLVPSLAPDWLYCTCTCVCMAGSASLNILHLYTTLLHIHSHTSLSIHGCGVCWYSPRVLHKHATLLSWLHLACSAPMFGAWFSRMMYCFLPLTHPRKLATNKDLTHMKKKFPFFQTFAACHVTMKSHAQIPKN